MTEDRAALHTQSAVRGQQGVAGHLRGHLARAPDDVRQDGAHGVARRTLETPDGDPTEPETAVMRVTRQAPAAATGRLMRELQPARQDERQHPFEKRLAVAKPLNVGRFVLNIDGAGAVCSRRFGRCAHVSPPGQQVSSADETRWGSRVDIARPS